MTDREKLAAIVRIIDGKKAKNIAALDVEEKTIIAAYFVICTAANAPQMKAIADEAAEQMAALGCDAPRIEGKSESGWILADFGGIILHIFTSRAREFYDLERLWTEAPRVDISEFISAD